MPNYTFVNKNTDEEFIEFFQTWSSKDQYLEENTHIKQIIGTPAFVTQTGSTLSKTSGDWRDHLKNIKKGAGKDNTIKV
tara:strand:+ start:490 stop:726 length:237 start_codon:yes stop_codon:yes gene_type:complete